MNLGNDRPVEINALIHIIEDAFGQAARIQHRERHMADPMATWVDIGRAKSLLGRRRR